jgi:hypothetical protein
MAAEVKRRPDDVRLSPLADKVFECIARYTAFPWPVLLTQCRRCELDPANLDHKGLRLMLEAIASSVARFTSPGKGMALRRELEALFPHAKEREE